MANIETDRVYQEFKPSTKWTSEPDTDILIALLPGFKKEQLTVAITETRKLRLTGERPSIGNKWVRFHQEIPIPLTANIDSVSAIFKDNNLYIKLPKIKTELPQTKQPSPTKPPVIIKPRDQHVTKQEQGLKEVVDESRGGLSSKDEEKEKVGVKWFEKYKEATGNVVKEVRNKKELLCNLAASVSLVLVILLYARNVVRSTLGWIS